MNTGIKSGTKSVLLIPLLLSIVTTLASAGTSSDQESHGLSLRDARHIVARTGLGSSPAEINVLLGKTRVEAVDHIIRGFSTEPSLPPPAWTNKPAPHHWRFGTLTSADKQKFRQARLSEIQSLRRWWISEMISTPSPQTERMVLFWHNHFATAYSALNHQSLPVARQHMMFREYGMDNFRTLLKQVIRDTAMLNYLDNNNSKKQKPNENLARELLELFTLGEGSYQESDIKNAARALTGNSYLPVYDLRYVFHYWNHDDGQKKIFGKTGDFDGDDLVDLILEQPDTARFITAKLWRILVGKTEKNDEKLAAHASAFRDSDYDIKTLYRSILLSDDFWHADNRAAIVQSPVSLSIGAIRSTGILPPDWQTLPTRLEQMGQHLFEPPNVAGWPGGAAWIAPGRLLARMEWLEQLIAGTELKSGDGEMSMQSESMGNDMQSSMMMASMNADTDFNETDQSALTIRMASEEFDEHARYRVKVFSQGRSRWDSGELELKGGHDTKKMGRVARNNIPWQTIRFPVHLDATAIEAIEVSFLNDDATPDGADRNLFISRASMGDRVWLPSDGKQTGRCARKKPEQQGNLYCAGTLRMEKSLTKPAVENTPLPSNTMRVSSAQLNFVRPAQRKPSSDLVFTLSDVEFQDRYWNSLNIRYLKDKSGFAVRLNNHDCWPECVVKWPECAWTEPYSSTTVTLDLYPGKPESNQCMYEDLTAQDRKLANTLWMLIGDLYRIGNNDPKMQRPKVAQNYKGWKRHVDKMVRLLPDSPFYDDTVKLEIIPRPIIDETLTEKNPSPPPAGLTSDERTASLQELLEREPQADLSTLLLPAKPLKALPQSPLQLSDVLTDLAFQLK